MISPPEALRFRGLKQWGEHKNLAESKSSSPRRRSPSPEGKAGSPSSVPGCARSTFPGGEGDLRRGLLGFGSAKSLLTIGETP